MSERKERDSTGRNQIARAPDTRNEAFERTGNTRGAAANLGDRILRRKLQRRAANRSADNGVAAEAEEKVAGAASSTGAPLPGHLQRKFEGALGANLSSVRVHTGADSAAAAEAVGAKAYTIGNDIHFAREQYQPNDASGEHLVAHEVAHTQQQAGGTVGRQNKLEVSTVGDAHEVEADRAADSMVAGRSVSLSASPAAVHRLADNAPQSNSAKDAALALRPELSQELDDFKKGHDWLLKARAEIEEDLNNATDEDKKSELKQKQKAIDEKISKSEEKVVQLVQDVKALDDPGTPPSTFDQILMRQKSGANTSVTDFDYHDGPYQKKATEKQETTTTSSYQDGKATDRVEDKKQSIGADGYKNEASDTRTTTSKDGPTKTEAESRKLTVGTSGVDDVQSQSTSTAQDGKKTGTEDKVSTHVGADGASRSASHSETDEEGTTKTTEKKTGVERGDGNLSGVRSSTSSEKSKEGETSTTTKLKGGIVDGDNGIGAGASADVARENKRESGLKTGVVAGLNGNICANVEKVSDNPAKYAVVVTIDLGVKLGGDAAYDKEGSSGSGSVGVTAGGHVVMTAQEVLGDEEAQAYVAALQSGSGSQREMRVIQAGLNEGWPAAQKMYLAMTNNLADPKNAAAMKDGEKIGIKKETSVGFDASAGGKSEGTSLGVSFGADADHDSSKSIEKKDGKLILNEEEGDKKTIKGGVNVGIGGVSGGWRGGHTDISATGYQFVVDPGDTAALAEFNNCKTEADYEAFAKNHPNAVKESSKTTGSKDSNSFNVSAGGVEGGFDYSHGNTEKVVKDADGKVKERVLTGTNSGGESLKCKDYKIGAQRTDTATAHIGADGDVSLDANSQSSETDMAKWVGANAPGMADKKDPEEEKKKGLLDKATGKQGEAPDTDDKDVTGLGMKKSDLGYLGSLACNDWGKWMAAGATSGVDIDDWAKAGREIQARGGGAAVTAEALSKFVGKGNSKDAIVNIARDTGDVSTGNRYEFPGSLAAQQPTYDALVRGEPEKALAELAHGDGGKDAANAKGTEVLQQLDQLHMAIDSRAADFKEPATRAEMLAAITTKKGQVQAALRVINGGKADVLSKKDLLDQYNDLLADCVAFKQQETTLLDKMQANIKGGEGSDVYEDANITKDLQNLYAVWEPKYAEMAKLAQENGFGQDIYWQNKPDKARFQRAKAGQDPGPPTAATRETSDFRTKKPPEQVHIVTDEEHRAERDKDMHGIEKDIGPASNQAQILGARLCRWIHQRPDAKALELHTAGLADLAAGDKAKAKLPAHPTEEDLAFNGFDALNAYNRAINSFTDGLKQYPPGEPPA
jgi:hypothetical protein